VLRKLMRLDVRAFAYEQPPRNSDLPGELADERAVGDASGAGH